MRQSLHVLAVLLLFVALLAAVLHVCVLPVGAHAPASGAHDGHHEHESGAAGEGVHAASCDLAAGTRGVPTAAPVPVPQTGPTVASIIVSPAVAPTAPAPPDSPPLFLLHAALLI